MALTNAERVGKALDALKTGLRPFVERELEAVHGKYWITEVTASWQGDLRWTENDEPHLDAALLLRILWEQWNNVFNRVLSWVNPSAAS